MAISKVQIKLDERIKKIGEKVARREGFSSYQELIRFWTVQAGRGNLQVKMGEEDLDYMSEEEILYAAEEALQEEKDGKLKGFETVEDLLKDLESDE